MARNKNYKKLVYVLILFVVFSLTIGYSAFSSELTISGIVADVRIEKDVRITDVEFVSAENGGIYNLDYDADSVIGNINLKGANSTVTLAVNVTNFCNTEMGIWDITGLSDNLVKQIDGYTMKDKLCDGTGTCMLGSITTFNITIGYDTYDAVAKDHEIRLEFDFREMHQVTYTGIENNGYSTSVIDGGNLTFTATSNIPPKIIVFSSTGDRYDYDLYSYVNGVFTFDNVTSDINLKYQEKAYLKTLDTDIDFKESTYKTVIDSVQFVDYVDTSNAVKTYDLSEASGSKDIIGWITADNDLYIGSEWNIYATTLADLFRGMSVLKTAMFQNLNTNEVTNFSRMFSMCTALESLDLSTFDTSNVTIMKSMFYETSNLTSLNIGNFDTSKVTNMETMFYGTNLTSLNLSHFNTSNVTSMAHMFGNNYNLTTLYIGNFDTSKVTNMTYMFTNCEKLTSLDLSNFNTSNVSNMTYMFSGCSALISLDVSNFDTANVITMDRMFYQCGSLASLNLLSFNTSNVTTMRSMFNGCSSLTSLDLSSFSTVNVADMGFLFKNCKKLSELNISSFNTQNVNDMNNMFYSCVKLVSLDLTHFNTSKVTTMDRMFSGCNLLESLNVSSFDTSNVTNMEYMFAASIMTELNLTSFNTSKVKKMSGMFFANSRLKNIYVSSAWSTERVTSSERMFERTPLLPNFDSNYIDVTKAYVGEGGYLSSLA